MTDISILLVEDQITDAELVIYYLKKNELAGQITHAAGKAEFLTALDDHAPDLILCDYHLPDIRALDALEILAARELDIPVIVLTGHIREEEAIECMRRGAKDYILKDRLARLPEAIRKALENRANLEKQQQTESSLKESEARFHALYESVPVALYRTTREGVIVECNQALVDLFGYETRESLLGVNVREKFFAEVSQSKKIWSWLPEDGNTGYGQFLAKRADEETIWIEDFTHIVRGDDGEVLFFEGYLKDITQTRRLQIEQETLLTINAELQQTEDIDEVVNVIAEQLNCMTDAVGLGVALLTKPDTLEVKYSGGVWSDWAAKEVMIENGVCEQVMNSLLPYHENNWPDKNIEGWKKYSDVQALVSLPLQFQDQALGIIWIGRNQPFSDEIIQSLTLIVDVVSVELNRKSLYLANQRALRESRALEEISRTLNQTQGLSPIFKLIVEFLVEITENSDRAIIHLYDAGEDQMFTVASARKDKKAGTFKFPHVKVLTDGSFDFLRLAKDSLTVSHLRSRQGVAGIAIADGKLVNVHDVQTDERFVQTETPTDIQSLLAVPIINDGRSLGAISLIANVPDAFDGNDEMLVERFGLQVTIAIENARLFEAERVQRGLAEAKSEISTALNQTLNLNKILDFILEQIQLVGDYRGVNVYLFDDGMTELVAYRGYDPATIASVNQKIQKKGTDGLRSDSINQVIKTKSPVIVDTAEVDEEIIRVVPELNWIRAHLSIPLLFENQLIGIVNIDSEETNVFTKNVIEVIQSYSEDAALAIRNAKLYAELEEALVNEQATRSRLIQADKLAGMGRMVASVAHELNNPLQTIKNCLFLMEQASMSGDNELLNLAMSEIERLAGIVGSLRDVYRPTHGTEFEEIPLLFFLEDVKLLLEMHLKRHSVIWYLEADNTKAFYVRGVPGQLKQIFLNLGLNAIEAMQPDGGDLYVEVLPSDDGKEIGVKFRDTGVGIPKEQLKFVFDPFFSTKQTGLGLGLSICYDIAQNHNGRIMVDSPTDMGAEFTLWLPLSFVEEN